MNANILLDVKDLEIRFYTNQGEVKAVDKVSLQVKSSGSLGLVGESGCGKTTTGYGIMRLIAENGYIAGGKVCLDGQNLLTLSEEKLRTLRWEKVAMVFQNAMAAMNPVLRIGDQIANAYLLHRKGDKESALKIASELFSLVGLPPSRLSQYPHEFSGGMKQRAMIAASLVCDPQLLIADEPTTALDVVAQRQILQVLGDLKQRFGLALILISHDISVVSELCENVAVMYAGQIIESGPTSRVFQNYHHPYTEALICSIPSLHTRLNKLTTLPGAPPSLINPPKGCRFAPRCSYKQSLCESEIPKDVSVGNYHYSRCHFANDIDFSYIKSEG